MSTFIEEWFDEQDKPTTALDFYLNGLQKRVYVIWYEVADDVDDEAQGLRRGLGHWLDVAGARLLRVDDVDDSGRAENAT